MIIQDVIWPQVDVCMQEEMYFRVNEKASRVGEAVFFNKGGRLQTDTYFNSISSDKWKKYTNVTIFDLELKLRGSFKIQLAYKKKIHEQIFEKIVAEQIFQSNEVGQVVMSFPPGSGMAYFKLEALEKDSLFYGGFYTTEILEEKIRDIKIGIGICTYRREDFIEHNLDVLNKYILENSKSEMYGHLEVFVSDNGKTLDEERLKKSNVHIVKNKNTGGAGGFTRDLIEMLKANNSGAGVTHALLMDDDIIIDPESLLRTYRILSLVKEEYQEAFVGGAMLRNDARNIQVESGASWNAGQLNSLKSNLNLNLCDACLYNEIEEYCEYNAWWYCCFPMTVVNEMNLPMPIFIRGDDLEYGLRNMKTLILMNGICVWHEPFENKYSSFLSYYILRNMFIDNALHFPGFKVKQAKKKVLSSIIREIVYFRYKNVDLIIRGIKDFLAGVDWLLETDGEQLHKEIMAAGYKAQEMRKLSIPFSYPIYEKSRKENDCGFKKLIRFVTINGYLLKPKRENIVAMASIRPYNAYRSGRILNYDITANRGFVTEKSWKEAIRCTIEMMKILAQMQKNYDRVAEEYRARSKEVQSIGFWKKYLEI